MAAVQSTIPFRSRKLMHTRSKRSFDIKEDIANNSGYISKYNTRKRRQTKEDGDGRIESDQSPPKKINKETRNLADKVAVEVIATDKIEVQHKNFMGRETEIDFIKKFLSDHLKKEESGSIYISGQPGTGKTASLTFLLELPEFKKGYRQVYVNCVMAKSPGKIYERVCHELKLKTSGTSEKACLAAVEEYLRKKHKMTLLVLDEIDYLESRNQAILYNIFEWATWANSRIVLVGVANALDLTERALPRLRPAPTTLHFTPYTKEQILDIFVAKLAEEDKSKMFSPVALQLLAAKMAAISGDMRRALDIGRRVIDLARRNKFAETKSVEFMLTDSTVTVELKQVLEVLNELYGGTKNLNNGNGDEFPIQQKLILGSLMLMLTKGKNKDIVLGKLYDVYKRVASARNIVPLTMGDFLSACTLIEVRGAVRMCGRGAPRTRRVQLHWDETELTGALRDKTLLAAILHDVACLTS
ncbi:Cell division control protein 6 homolog [Eumeta japonica]|uniref:Cell division control protein n=1 Tax=Eumeta variegata TaxID=151549 RepID=A0A4C1TEX6_EUMVA|nr:Cell division control protein 6 homolog [Eumeta japonica]